MKLNEKYMQLRLLYKDLIWPVKVIIVTTKTHGK